jgi:peptidoglycan/xylan/chitin deacetylase (PgdA/CDA1 family)
MQATVTIVTYHFVRDLRNSRFPAIKGLDLESFRGQLEFMQNHYTFVTMEDLLSFLDRRNDSLPSSAALLTFDDGYIDHFTNVFPLLDEMRIQGSFFPPAQTVLEHRVLDVNKIHFVLASISEPKRVVQSIMDAVNQHKAEFDLADVGYYWEHCSTGHRYDPPEVIFIKRMLQKALPARLRVRLIDDLFRRYVTPDEGAFARELYMGMDQLRCMHRHGMFIGSHGHTHCWLDSISPEEQEREIDLSRCFLRDLGVDTDNWVMCYPYGGYNEPLLAILRRKGCRLGLTVNVGLADLRTEDPLAISRLDTNDLPKRPDGASGAWTFAAIHHNR